MSYIPTLSNDVQINGFLESSVFIGVNPSQLPTILSQTGTTIIGVNGDFTADMQGGVVIFSDKTTAFITGFINTFVLTVTPSQTMSVQGALIIFGGTQMDENGISSNNINATNLFVVDLTGTTITATNEIISEGDVIVAGDVNTATITTSGDAIIGGDIVVAGSVVVDNVTVTGNITAGGTIQGATLVSTGNISAVDTVSASNITVTGNITANGTVQGDDVIATNTLSGANITSSGGITAVGTIQGDEVVATDQVSGNTVVASTSVTALDIIAGTGGIQSSGNISTTNGNITTTNGNIIVTNGMIQTNNITVTGTLTVQGSIKFTTATTGKGQILVSNGTSIVGQSAGIDGSPVIYNSATSTGLQSAFFISNLNPETPIGWSGATVVMQLVRLGTIAYCWLSFSGTNNTMTNTLGSSALFGSPVVVPNALLPTNHIRAPIYCSVNGTPQYITLDIETYAGNLNYLIYPANQPDTYNWPNGTILKIDASTGVMFTCTG